MTSKKRKVTISNKIDDDQDTAVESDIEMTECNIFCNNSYKNLKVLESKITRLKVLKVVKEVS